MKKYMVAAILATCLTACGTQHETVSRETSTENNEKDTQKETSVPAVADVTKTPEEGLETLFAHIQEENAQKVIKDLRYFDKEMDEEGAKRFINEWKGYNYLENVKLTIVDLDDLVKEDREEIEQSEVERVWVVGNYKDEKQKERSKLFLVAEHKGAYYLENEVWMDEGASVIKKEKQGKYGITPPETSQTNGNEAAPEEPKKDTDIDTSDGADNIPPVEQVTPQTEYDYQMQEYIIADRTLAELMNKMFAEHSSELGTKMVSFQRGGDYEFYMQTDKRELDIIFEDTGDTSGSKWKILDWNTKKVLFSSEQKKENVEADYKKMEINVRNLVNELFEGNAQLLGNEILSVERKNGPMFYVETDNRELQVDVLMNQDGTFKWTVYDWNTGNQLLTGLK